MVAVAVTVTDPPKDTLLPLMVMALFVRLELAMSERVLDDPLIDLLVSV